MAKLYQYFKYAVAAAAGGSYVAFVNPVVADFVAWLNKVLN